MKRTLSVVFVAAVAASPAFAQDVARTSQLRLSQEAIGRAVFAASVVASRQEPAGSWDTLVAVAKIGRAIDVTLANSTHLKGRLLAIDAHSISVEQRGGARVLAPADVLRVRYAGTRKRHVIHGMLIGMAAGGAATAIIDRRSSHPSSAVEAAGLGAIFIGLPAGAVVGALLPGDRVLYEATERPGGQP